ncbi:MAG: flagellin [Sinobacteraceae bacterium]|nr:flagellin [Nevskiaceae bacterium]MCP5339074.1 flagellin [Nevskiaceae bacterium]MCP5359983.1 flagellin [Nevskiaceae bacterium]MCP5472197.1 flagellin [Nevskiaceae bacterium]
MAQVINTNVMSLNAQRNLATSGGQLATSLQRLSSGLRINSAKDDAAGLAISERFTSQIRGLNQAVRNASDGISLSQTAEGALASIGNNLQRMRELAVQSANSTNSASDRAALQQEVAQLAAEIDRVATQTQFNGLNLLDGTFSAQQFQVGANAGQTITISAIASARTSALGQFQGFQLTGQGIGTASDSAAAQSVTVGGTTVSLGTIANDAKALAAAMNASGVAGLSATANATVVAAGTSADSATASGAATITVNGIAISVAGVDGNLAQSRANAVAALNAQSAVTGVVAQDTGSGVSLTAADGRNITVAYSAGGFTGSALADFGLAAAATTGGTINVTYNAPAGTSGNMTWTGAFNPGPNAIAATGTSMAAVDISSVSGANAALTAIDAALTSVNSNRAQLGAIQNRFESTIANLQTTSENLSASRSRIQDADFAAETALLTRAQILQQAGTAILSQANAVPQNVLTLLR